MILEFREVRPQQVPHNAARVAFSVEDGRLALAGTRRSAWTRARNARLRCCKGAAFFGTIYGAGDLVYLDSQVYEVKVCIQVDRAHDIPQMGWIQEQLSFVSQPTSVGSRWRRGIQTSYFILDEAVQRSLRLVQTWSCEDESHVLVLG